MIGFKVFEGRGFHLTFKNGVTISVQFGSGNYCEHYNNDSLLCSETLNRQLKAHESVDAEVAAWDKAGLWFDFEKKKFGGGNPIGYLNPNDILKIMNELAAWKFVPVDEINERESFE